MERPALKALRDKVRKGKKTLKHVYRSPYRGVLTGRNEAFVIDRATRDRLVAEDPKSAEILKPFLEGRDLKRWRAEPRDMWLIFTRRGVDIETYPAVLRYLEGLREKIEPKPADWTPVHKDDKWPGRKSGSYQWYEIQDTVDYYAEFAERKIMYPHFSVQPLFQVQFGEVLSNDKSYIIPTGATELAAYLNSNVLWFVLTGMAPPVRGGFYEMRTPYIDQLPIPATSDAQKAELAALAEACQTAAEQRYRLQQDFARRIPDLAAPGTEPKLTNKLKDWWALPDFAAFRAEVKKTLKADIPLAERTEWEDWMARDKAENARLSAEIKANEDRINQIVYRLFDLTPDEIALLETKV